MVIFGAGASYDSSREHRVQGPWARESVFRPPLAADLFHSRFGEVIERHHDSWALFDRLRTAADRRPPAIEEELEAISNDAEKIPLLRRQLLDLRDYLCDAVAYAERRWKAETHGISNYGYLLHYLLLHLTRSNDSLTIVTFNYDTLIDDAFASAFSKRIQSIDDYISNPRYRLFKVHGSINWWRLVGNVQGSPLDSAERLQLTNVYKYLNHPQPPDKGFDYVRAVAVPMATKNDFECPPPHIDSLRSVIPEVDRLLVVGWRGVEAHFHELLKLHGAAADLLKKLYIVSGSAADAEQTAKNLLAGCYLVGDDQATFAQGFSAFLDGDGLQKFLRS